MAMIPTAFASACASKLAALVADRIASGLGVEADVRRMQRRMECVRGVLEDAERRRVHETGVDAWLDELRDFLYDADDILDLCRCRGSGLASAVDLPRCWPSVNLVSSFQRLQFRYEIGGRIRRLDGRFEEICQDRLFLSLAAVKAEDGARAGSCVRSRTSSPLADADVVGKEIKAATEVLVEMVMREDDKDGICVISVVGMGGIGKTTLAQEVFNSQRIASSFPLRAWLCVSREYTAADTVKEAIRCCGGDYGRAETLAELQLMLRSAVSGRRFFLVLDDVWVSLLRASFQGAATGRVLVTTRDQSVAVRAGSKHIHQVKQLGADSGWELLYKTAGLEAEEIRSLRDLGMEIVAKCGFLPLTIKVIGGLLTTKRTTKAEWQRILVSDAWSTAELPDEFKGAIFLSYHDLPSQLKQCFLYLSLFPSGFVYYRWHLCRQWVAEGFVAGSGEFLAEELAEEYYYQLITRSILQPHQDYLADQSRCTVHDLLSSFARYISRRESVFGDPQATPCSTAQAKLRRLSLTNIEEVKVPHDTSSNDYKCVRTLFLIGTLKVESRLVVRFANLRTLLLTDTKINKIPDSIGHLELLRYLGLEQVSVSTLPESISRLSNLQFLNLKRCASLNALPRTLTRIYSLRRLGIEETPIRLVPHGIGRLHSLTDLQGFIVSSGSSCSGRMQQGWTMIELENLAQLRWLRIDHLERATVFTAPVLVSKRYLKRLELSCTPESERGDTPWTENEIEKVEAIFERLLPSSCLEELLVRGFFGRKYPAWMEASYLCNVTWLKLIDCKFSLCLPPLGQLPHLTFLKIARADSVVAVGSEFLGDGTKAFPKLEFLWIGLMPEWQEWTLDKAREAPTSCVNLFPCLQQLELKYCPKLLALPEQLKHAVKMQKLYIQGTHSLKMIGNLPYLSSTLRINGSHGLTTISDLCQVRALYVTDCPSLQSVNSLKALTCLHLDDQRMDCFPEWLSRLMQRSSDLSADSLELELHCNARMLYRCLRGGQDWDIIEQFSSVSAFCKEGGAYMCYTRHPPTYHTNRS
ncbi:unnamed protein product [Urochloa decumbens]|uniref:Uncharacterized protein n=1 Tax=Urochloa decumbens TaxID=240449 RepID=A0ABC8WEF9_9POAL